MEKYDIIKNYCLLTLISVSVEHVLFSLFEHCLYVKKSVIHNAAVLAQAPPKFVNVFNKVILVPPNNGSLIRAKNAITATNIEYIVNYLRKKQKYYYSKYLKTVKTISNIILYLM